MRISFWAAVGIMIVGAVILLWPDSGDRIISFNEAHGPSFTDLIGLFLVIFPWLWMVIKTIARRTQVIGLLGKRNLAITITVIVLASLVIGWSLISGNDLCLYAGILFASAGWLVLFVTAFYDYPKERKVIGLSKERLN